MSIQLASLEFTCYKIIQLKISGKENPAVVDTIFNAYALHKPTKCMSLINKA